MQNELDTSDEAGRIVGDRIMKLSGSERFIIGCQMFESARAVKRHGLVNDALRAIELDGGAVVTDDKIHLFAAPDPAARLFRLRHSVLCPSVTVSNSPSLRRSHHVSLQ